MAETKAPKTFKISMHDRGRSVDPIMIECSGLDHVLPIVYHALLAFMQDAAFCKGCPGCEHGKYDTGCGDQFKPYTEADLVAFCTQYSYSASVYEVKRIAVPPEIGVGTPNLLTGLVAKYPTLYGLEDVYVWSMDQGDELPPIKMESSSVNTP